MAFREYGSSMVKLAPIREICLSNNSHCGAARYAVVPNHEG